jgi:hypothetical protein
MSFKKWSIAFPVILEGLGADQVMDELSEMGQSDLILCAIIYHGYRMVMPRHPRQIYQLEAGMTFYPSDQSFYKDCKIKQVSTQDFAGRDLFQEASKAAEKAGISLSAWITCFANSRVARDFPEVAMQNLYGSRDRLFLCFNNPEVQKYCWAMFRDLATRYPLSSMMADKIPQSMLELNSFAGRIDPILRLAGSICFCDHCMEQAKKDSIDLAEAKKILLRAAEASRKVPQWAREAMLDDLRGDTEIPLFMLEEPLIADVLRWRIDCIVRFLAHTRQMVQSIQPGVKVSVCFVPPVKVGHDATSPRAWLGAQSYRKFSTVVDAIHGVIHWEPEVVAYDTRRARDMVDAGNLNCELVIHVAAYGRRRPEDMAGLVQAARGQGADGMAFFCHDLLDEPMIAALKTLPD